MQRAKLGLRGIQSGTDSTARKGDADGDALAPDKGVLLHPVRGSPLTRQYAQACVLPLS